MSPPIWSWSFRATSRLLGEPVSENLLFSVVRPSQNVCFDLIDLRVLFKVGDSELDPASGFRLDKPTQFRLKARTVLDAPLNLQPGEADRAPRANAALDRG